MKLFKKPNSKFYWYDFTVRSRHYRASTKETKSVQALNIASLKLASVIENTDPLPSKPTALGNLAERFLAWVGGRQVGRSWSRSCWLRGRIGDVSQLTICSFLPECIHGIDPSGPPCGNVRRQDRDRQDHDRHHEVQDWLMHICVNEYRIKHFG